MSLKLTKCLVAELLGTTLLLATVIGSGIMAERLSEGNEAIALLGNTIATGAILYVLITMFGSISGAHFNPAVTLSFLLLKEIKPSHASLYIIFQLVGAIAGMMLAHGMFEENFVQVSTKIRTGHGQWLSEGVATFGLVAAILATLRWRPEAIPAAVGLYIVAAYWFTASTSFANPAVTIARSFTNTFSGITPTHTPEFILAQLIGAILATVLMSWLLSSQKPN